MRTFPSCSRWLCYDMFPRSNPEEGFACKEFIWEWRRRRAAGRKGRQPIKGPLTRKSPLWIAGARSHWGTLEPRGWKARDQSYSRQEGGELGVLYDRQSLLKAASRLSWPQLLPPAVWGQPSRFLWPRAPTQRSAAPSGWKLGWRVLGTIAGHRQHLLLVTNCTEIIPTQWVPALCRAL